ncbi:MAG: ribosome-recycling factor [Fidelibacterota bacterium]
MDIKEFFSDATSRMDSAVEHCRNELAQIRTGRASPALLDSVKVSYYGSPTPLKTVANIVAQDATLLIVQPYDRSILGDIEKAIQMSSGAVSVRNACTAVAARGE